MPAKGSINPTAAPAAITAWLDQHPGEHRTRDVAQGLGVPEGMKPKDWTQKVGNALGRLARDGDVRRVYRDIGHARPVGHYTRNED